MKNIVLTIYPILWLVLTFAGAKFSGRKKLSKDFLSLEQTKLIRGSACIGVMLHHVTQQVTMYGAADKGVITLFNFGGFLFTALFFFFSGYGLILNEYTKEDYLHTFLTKRLPAVLIPFWLINIGVVFIKIFVLRRVYVPADAIKDILGITLINSNGWFIIEIVIFYIAFFLLFDLIKKKDVALVLLCVFVLCVIRFAFFRGHDPAGAKSSWFRGEWWFNSTITFVFGMLFARFREKTVWFLNRFYVAFLPVTMVLAWLTFYHSIHMVKVHGYYGSLLVGAGTRSMLKTLVSQSVACIAFTLLVLLINMRLKLGNPILAYIGSISMEFFLLHGYFVSRIFGSMAMSDVTRYAVCFACSLACTAVAAPVIGFVKKRVIAVACKQEIYDLFPIASIAEKLKINDMKDNFRKIAVAAAVLAALIPIGFAVRYIILQNECKQEMNVLQSAAAGDVVLWGRFQTDAIPGRERLEWIVLEKRDEKVCLVTKQGIASATYNQKHETVSWEESDIISFINSKRFMNSFSKGELSHMIGTEGEYLSLLTEAEVVTFFPIEKERELSITEAAEREGANINSMSKANEWDMKGYRSSWWWLKGEGEDVYAPIVTVDGEISKKEVNRPNGAVRPVIWVEID